MLKTLLFLGIIAFVIWFFFLKNRTPKQTSQNTQNNAANSQANAISSMVECKTCKTFVSQSEGILSNGSYFCSKECLLKA